MHMRENFLQSEHWLRFQEAAGHEVIRMADGDGSVGGIVYSLPLAGKYLYTPRYPSREAPNSKFQIPKILDDARRLGCGWVRVEPGTEATKKGILKQVQDDHLKFVHAPHDMQPRETFVVDIAKSEEELLAAMKSKTRYNIRLAEKKGVRVFQTTDEKYQKAFVDLARGTADRKGIAAHPREYYEAMLGTLLGDTATLFVAEHEGDILGINFMTYHDGVATYLHGGSSDTKREYMAPFLLQWEAMKDAKRRGCNFYDFGGIRIHSKIENRKSSIDSWAGITRFKTGFSPATAPTVFPGCYDIVLSPSHYFLYIFFSTARAWIAKVRKLVGVY